MDGEGRRNDALEVATAPVPGGDLAPEAVRGLPGFGVHFLCVDVDSAATLDERLAVDDDGVHIASTAEVDQGLDGVGVEGRAEVIEVDEQDISLRTWHQASQVIASQEGASPQGGRDELLAMEKEVLEKIPPAERETVITLPDAVVESINALVGCVAGTVKEADYLEAMRTASLTEIVVVSRFVYEEERLCGFFANGAAAG